jgi:hypothetical protein
MPFSCFISLKNHAVAVSHLTVTLQIMVVKAGYHSANDE